MSASIVRTRRVALAMTTLVMAGLSALSVRAALEQASPGSNRVATPTRAPTLIAAQRHLAGSPPLLAGLHAQAGRLLGDEAALVARVRSLRGYPVIVNAWASWCGPCRQEFPILAAAAARYGRDTAFLGLDTTDEAAGGRAFLAHHPLSYPSYQSSSRQLLPLGVLEGLPTTIFISRAGRVVSMHTGQYDSLQQLEADVARAGRG